MILSDREIRSAIERRSLSIDPLPKLDAWSSTAVDLTLDRVIRRWTVSSGAGLKMEFDPSHPEFDFLELSEKFTERIDISNEGYSLAPGAFVLAWTVERIALPQTSRIAARVEGKSSLARLGLGIHVTAPTIHAGFGYKRNDSHPMGTPLQLEVWHVGPLPIRLKPGMSICQLIFEEVHGTPEKGYGGIFSSQGE